MNILDLKSHLHCHSTYSLIDAPDTPEVNAQAALNRNMEFISITDHGYTSAIPSLMRFCDENNKKNDKKITGIPGCEFYVDMSAQLTGKKNIYGHITIWALNDIGYKNLLKLFYHSWDKVTHKFGKKKPMITWDLLEEYNEGLGAGTGCLVSTVARPLLLENDPIKALQNLDHLIAIFGKERLMAEFIPHQVTHDYSRDTGKFVQNECTPFAPDGDILKGYQLWLWDHAVLQRGLKPFISLDSHFTTPDKKPIQDAMLMNGETGWHFSNSYHFLSKEEIYHHLSYLPGHNAKMHDEMIMNAYDFCKQIKITPMEKKLHLPFQYASKAESYAAIGNAILEDRINKICDCHGATK